MKSSRKVDRASIWSMVAASRAATILAASASLIGKTAHGNKSSGRKCSNRIAGNVGVFLLAVAFAGCGAEQLTVEQTSTVARVNSDAALYALDGSSEDYGDLLDGVPEVIDIYRTCPGCIYSPDGSDNGDTMRNVLKDLATTLEGTEFQDQIDRELE